MPFKPLGFTTLSVNTLNLEERFSILLGRYRVATPSSTTLSSTILDSLLNKVRKISSCDTKRTTQRDVFTQLANELSEVLREGQEYKIQQATLFLLGALLHRYFRLLKESEKLNSYTYFSFFSMYDPTNCRLFIAIREALGLPAIAKDDKAKEVKTKDLEEIDVVTIVTALEVFRDNMFDSDTAPRYKKYPHFEKDKNFKFYLDEIITEHKTRGATLLTQFHAIHFIQSLEKQFKLEHSLLNETLQNCELDLAKTYPDFNILNQELLETWMEQKIKSPFYKGLIVDLIGSPYFKATLESLKQSSESNETKEAKYISLIDTIQTCYLEKARFILSGGYALVLEWISAQNIKEVHDLKSCIKQALGLEQNPEDFADSDIQTCLHFLSDFIDERPSMVLNTTFFGSQDKMKTKLMRSRSVVAERIEQEHLVRPGVTA